MRVVLGQASYEWPKVKGAIAKSTRQKGPAMGRLSRVSRREAELVQSTLVGIHAWIAHETEVGLTPILLVYLDLCHDSGHRVLRMAAHMV